MLKRSVNMACLLKAFK